MEDDMKGKKINFKISDNLQRGVSASLLLLPGILVVLPVVLLVTGSVMDQYELAELLKPIFREKGAGEAFQFITWRLVPDFPSFANYGKLLFLSPQFFVLFWNSVKMVLLILAGQLLIGVPAAWAFAAYQNRFGKLLFTLYVVLMLLPFQVTMLSSYLVLNGFSLLNTHTAVILPAVFSTFPVFLCYGGFRGIPMQLFEAARVDGATIASGEKRYFVGSRARISGILEYDGAAHGLSGRQVAVAVILISAGNHLGAGGLCFLRFHHYFDTGCFCVCAWAGLFRAGDYIFGFERIESRRMSDRYLAGS